jgi:Raf kinase inhibitor-like YbhB/YbcL family protein
MNHAGIRGRAIAAVLAATLLLAACSGGGASPSAAAASKEADMAGFVLTSPSFAEGGSIPTKYSCDGSDLSPALSWNGAPAGTTAFALIVDDPDAGGWVHWVVFDLPGGTSGSLPEGVPASAPPQGITSFGRSGYGGPCPPSGTHHYVFTLYALSGPLGLTGAPNAAAVRAAVQPILLAQATLKATYTRR